MVQVPITVITECKRFSHFCNLYSVHFSTYLSRIVSVPPDLKKYRKWVKKLYQPQVFVSSPSAPSTVQATPNFQVTTYQTTNGRQALLPTPPSPYSPCVNLVSPFTYTTNTNTYNPSPYYTNSNVRNNIRMNNFTNSNTIITTTQPVQVAYVYQNSFSNTEQQKKSPVSQIYPSTNQNMSPVKSVNGQQNFVNNSVSTTMNNRTFTNPAYATSRRNNNNTNIYYKQRDSYDRRPNSRNSSRNSSPRNSPKINSKEISNQNSRDRDYYKKDFSHKDYKEKRRSATPKPLTDSDFPPISKTMQNDKLNKQGKSMNTQSSSESKYRRGIVPTTEVKSTTQSNDAVIIENSKLKGPASQNQTILIESSDEEGNTTIVLSSDHSSSDET